MTCPSCKEKARWLTVPRTVGGSPGGEGGTGGPGGGGGEDVLDFVGDPCKEMMLYLWSEEVVPTFREHSHPTGEHDTHERGALRARAQA